MTATSIWLYRMTVLSSRTDLLALTTSSTRPQALKIFLAAEAEATRQTKAIFDVAHGGNTASSLARMSSVFEED